MQSWYLFITISNSFLLILTFSHQQSVSPEQVNDLPHEGHILVLTGVKFIA
jgi:hypothetical protein